MTGTGISVLRPLPQPDPVEGEFEQLLADAFRQSGWKIQARPLSDEGAGLVAAKGKFRYAVALKKSSEGRKDRLIPLLAQAILEAQAAVRAEGRKSIVPLAVIGAPRIPESLLPNIRKFSDRYAPGVAIGLLDQEGYRAFMGPGLESLNARRAKPRLVVQAPGPSSHLFSDLNQWMLKVLFAPRIPEDMIAAPREEYRNASQLAKAAGVSVMSAFRFVRQLEIDGFLDQSEGVLKLVRIPELMRRWQAANLRPPHEIAMKFIIRGSESQFRGSLRSYALQLKESLLHPSDRPRGNMPRFCLGLFAAADALRVGFVHGVPPYIYLEELNSKVLEGLALQPAEGDKVPDVYIRIPWAPEAVFRAVVERHGVPVSDILQVWLDVSFHPARGSAQADQIRDRLLARIFEGGQ
jgi:hypothetical protein